MRRSARVRASLLCLALLAGPVVHAQDTTEARLRDALRDTAEKLHATEAELAQQQLATAAAERERDALKQAPAAKVDVAQTAALQRRLAAAASELSQAQADGQKWQAQQQASAQLAQTKEAERAALAKQLSKLRERAERCVANDDAFLATGREIAVLYRDPTFVSFIRSHHWSPLGFDRVKQENRVRGLEDRFNDEMAKADQCRAEVTATPAPPTAPIKLTPPASVPAKPSSGGDER